MKSIIQIISKKKRSISALLVFCILSVILFNYWQSSKKSGDIQPATADSISSQEKAEGQETLASSPVAVMDNETEESVQNKTVPEYEIPRFSNIHSALLSEIAEYDGIVEVDEASFQPASDRLNLAYYYSPDADDSDVLHSYAGEVYNKLMNEDARYIADIYDACGITPLEMARRMGISSANVLGKYNPDDSSHNNSDPSSWFIPNFRRVNVAFYDADGNQTTEYSNIKDIMSMASVYCYQHNYLDHDTFEKICLELYKKSHSYRISIGSVYYDDGCIHRTVEDEAKLVEQEEQDNPSQSNLLEFHDPNNQGNEGIQSASENVVEGGEFNNIIQEETSFQEGPDASFDKVANNEEELPSTSSEEGTPSSEYENNSEFQNSDLQSGITFSDENIALGSEGMPDTLNDEESVSDVLSLEETADNIISSNNDVAESSQSENSSPSDSVEGEDIDSSDNVDNNAANPSDSIAGEAADPSDSIAGEAADPSVDVNGEATNPSDNIEDGTAENGFDEGEAGNPEAADSPANIESGNSNPLDATSPDVQISETGQAEASNNESGSSETVSSSNDNTDVSTSSSNTEASQTGGEGQSENPAATASSDDMLEFSEMSSGKKRQTSFTLLLNKAYKPFLKVISENLLVFDANSSNEETPPPPVEETAESSSETTIQNEQNAADSANQADSTEEFVENAPAEEDEPSDLLESSVVTVESAEDPPSDFHEEVTDSGDSSIGESSEEVHILDSVQNDSNSSGDNHPELTFTDESAANPSASESYGNENPNNDVRNDSEDNSQVRHDDDPNDKNYCPGHVDLYVSITVYQFDDKNGLRSINLDADNELEARDAIDEYSRWEGWNQANLLAVQSLISQDWFRNYGLSISSLDPKIPLTGEEVSAYLDGLPVGISEERKTLIRYALGSVGKIPYYWGGKASGPGYESNGFGRVIGEADYKGRILRGLDCSGWIQWVYWSALGKTLGGAASTSTLIGVGEKIRRADLKPGDIIIRVGADSHVVMFLSWLPNGNMMAIHENSYHNNVSVNEVTANYPYYRRILE